MAGWDVDDQIADSACAYGLQMVTNCTQMGALHKGRLRFEHRPSLAYEFMQASESHFRLQVEAAQCRPVPRWRRVAGVDRR